MQFNTQGVNFEKSQTLLAETVLAHRAWEFEADKIRYGVYVTRHGN